MTTAAATIVEGGRFTGQSMAGWTAPGQQVTLRITKALTIHTEHSEHEEEGQRDIVLIAGDNYRRTMVRCAPCPSCTALSVSKTDSRKFPALLGMT